MTKTNPESLASEIAAEDAWEDVPAKSVDSPPDAPSPGADLDERMFALSGWATEILSRVRSEVLRALGSPDVVASESYARDIEFLERYTRTALRAALRITNRSLR